MYKSRIGDVGKSWLGLTMVGKIWRTSHGECRTKTTGAFHASNTFVPIKDISIYNLITSLTIILGDKPFQCWPLHKDSIRFQDVPHLHFFLGEHSAL